MLTTLAPLITFATKDAASTPSTSTAAAPMPPSSPPPQYEDELRICLEAFGRAKNIDDDTISWCVDAFQNEEYTADVINEATVGRLQEITGLSEGSCLALKKFSREWCGRIERKRAKHSK
jgi:hypothetical protein